MLKVLDMFSGRLNSLSRGNERLVCIPLCVLSLHYTLASTGNRCILMVTAQESTAMVGATILNGLILGATVQETVTVAILHGLDMRVAIEDAAAACGVGICWLDGRLAAAKKARLLIWVCSCGGHGLGGLSVLGSEKGHCA
jgi:hypothetical protein